MADYERFEAIAKEVASSEEMAAKVLKKISGSYVHALHLLLEHAWGVDDPDLIDDASEALENAVDSVLNEAVEKEILGVIPKEF